MDDPVQDGSIDAVGQQHAALAPLDAGLAPDRIGLLDQVGVDCRNLLPAEDAVEQGVQVPGASVEKCRHPEVHVRRQRRGRQRSDGPSEEPEPQVHGPAREDHPGERIGRVPDAT